MFRKVTTSIAACAAAMFAASTAHAGVTFVFQNPDADLPTEGNFTTGGTCNGIGISDADLCTVDNALGLTYEKGGYTVNAVVFSGETPVSLIQDLSPNNSGLGALSPGKSFRDDQIQPGANESILFDFGQDVKLTGIDFNAGNDTNCATPGSEGECGLFTLIVDDVVVLLNAVALDDMVFSGFIGQTFRIIASGMPGTGFVIGSLTVQEVPLPGAALVLLTGVAGLGFAGRRRRAI